jgi:dihydrofolate reductase
MIAIIAALTRRRVIGKDGRLPWSIPDDLKNFRRLTDGKTVVMGRKTFESIGRPLPNRHNIVVSRDLEPRHGIEVCRSFDEAIEKGKAHGTDIFVIGGAAMYQAALRIADRLYLSWVKKDYDGDAFFPEFDGRGWSIIEEKDHPDFVFTVYGRA